MRGLKLTSVFLIAASGFLAQAVGYSESRPNILLIVSDDLNTDLGCYGNQIVKTPNIDRLASRGVRFDNAYCQGTVCNSSRASIFSGLRPSTTDVLDNDTPWPKQLPNLQYMPAYFQQQGYFTATFGKILDHKRVPEQPYWDQEVKEWGKYPDEDQILQQGRLYPGSPGSVFWAKVKGPDAITPDGEMAVEAVKMLEQQAEQEQPFFAAVGFRRPHTPFAVPSKYFDLYSPDAMQLPVVPDGYRETLPSGITELKPFTGGKEEAKQALAAYYACISYVDSQVGVLLQAVDRLKLWDNTVVIFISDHGYHTGHNALWYKGWLFEQTTLTPTIVAAPGYASGACQRVVELLDLYPTLVDFAGQKPLAALPGTSLLPLLKNPQAPWHRNAVSSIGVLDADHRRIFVGHSIRTADFRYTQWDQGKQGVELYNLANDAQGLNNLVEDSRYADKRAKLQVLLHQALESRK